MILTADAQGAPNCLNCRTERADRQEPFVPLGSLAFLKADRYPIVAGHVLLYPMSHQADIFKLGEEEYRELMSSARLVGTALKLFTGFRVGMFTAGKEVTDHCHIHLLPLEHGLKATFARLGVAPRPELLAVEQERLLMEITRRIA